MSLIDGEAVPRRTMHLFFMVDVSGSMMGAKIGAVNDAIRNVLPIVSDISDTNPDAEIKIAAMTFSNGSDWMYDTAKAASDFEWVDQTAMGGTDLGEACRDMEKVLHHKSGWMGTGSGSYAPVIILLSDGGPTDDFESGIVKLKANAWFKAGIKVAIAIGDDADVDILAKFTGNIERVIRVHDIESLKKVIRVVVVTSSQVGSTSSSATDSGKEIKKEDEVAKAVTDEIKDDSKVEIGTDITDGGDDIFDDFE